MNAEERQVAEIKRVKAAMQKTESKKLKKQYGRYLFRLESDLNEYRKWRKNEISSARN